MKKKQYFLFPIILIILNIAFNVCNLNVRHFQGGVYETGTALQLLTGIYLLYILIKNSRLLMKKDMELKKSQQLISEYENTINVSLQRLKIMLVLYKKLFGGIGRSQSADKTAEFTNSEKVLMIMKSFDKKNLRPFFNKFKTISLMKENSIKIPYLVEILKTVINNTEKATNTLIDRFSQLLDESNHIIIEAEKNTDYIKDSQAEENFEELISNSKSAISDNKNLMQDLVGVNKEIGNKFNEIDLKINEIYRSLKSIDEISQSNKIIHINLSIEAVKLGEKGKGIQVIVSEIHKLHLKTTDFIKQIHTIMKSFKDHNDIIISTLKKENQNMIEKIGAESVQSEKIVNKLINSYESANKLVNKLKDSNKKVIMNMSDIMISLQYQDITRQQIESVILFLSEIQSSIKDENTLFGRFIMPSDVDNSLINKIESDIRSRAKAFDENIILNTREKGGLL